MVDTATFAADMSGKVAEPVPPLDRGTHARMFVRCLGIQGSWNYELLVGNGVGFCVEPALRRLPGGVDGPAYNAALARQCAYFNAHPYLASLAVGALARAEVDMAPPEKIERFRKALCGPLGNVSCFVIGGCARAGNTVCASLRPWEPRCCSTDLATLGGWLRLWEDWHCRSPSIVPSAVVL